MLHDADPADPLRRVELDAIKALGNDRCQNKREATSVSL
jgi:hypothetical protein